MPFFKVVWQTWKLRAFIMLLFEFTTSPQIVPDISPMCPDIQYPDYTYCICIYTYMYISTCMYRYIYIYKYNSSWYYSYHIQIINKIHMIFHINMVVVLKSKCQEVFWTRPIWPVWPIPWVPFNVAALLWWVVCHLNPFGCGSKWKTVKGTTDVNV